MVEDDPFRRWKSAVLYVGLFMIPFGVGIAGAAALSYPEEKFWGIGVCVAAVGVAILVLLAIFGEGGGPNPMIEDRVDEGGGAGY